MEKYCYIYYEGESEIDKSGYYKETGEGLTTLINKAHKYKHSEALDILGRYSDCDGKLEIIDLEGPFEILGSSILILGDARHGKDTLAEILKEEFKLTHLSSSVAALDIFLFNLLKSKYGLKYSTKKEAYEDRVNHRDKWYNEICEYNKKDPTKLVKEILKKANIYIGLRSKEEVEKAIEEKTFDHIIGIYDYRKPRESSKSNTVDVFKYSDVVIMNNGSIEDLRAKVLNYLNNIS